MEILEACGGSGVWTGAAGSYGVHYGKIGGWGSKLTRFAYISVS